MKRILLIIILLTLTGANFAQVGYSRSVFKDSAGVNVPVNFKDFKFGSDVFFTTPIDTAYSNSVSKINQGYGTTITKNSKDYTVAVDNSIIAEVTDVMWRDSSGVIVPKYFDPLKVNSPFTFGSTLNSYPIRQGIALSDTTKFLLLADTTALHYSKLAAKFNTADTTAFNSKTLTTAQLSYKADTSSVLWKDSSGVNVPKNYNPFKINQLLNIGTLTASGLGKFPRLSVAGEHYNHVMLAIGYGDTTSTEAHQVGAWSLVKGNRFTDGSGGFIAGFESGLGTTPGYQTVPLITNFSVASMDKGAGTTITRTIGFGTFDETAGTNNACIAPGNDEFTGNYFIHYNGARESYLGGKLSLAGNLEITKGIQDSWLKATSSGDYSRFQVINESEKGLYVVSYGSLQGGTSYGLTNNNLTLALATGNAGLVTGTTLSAPLLFITNNIERMRISNIGEIVVDSLTSRNEASKIDSARIISLEAGRCGWGEVMIGDAQEWATFHFTTAGAVTLRTNSTNVSTTAFNPNTLNIYDAGTGVAIQNYLSAGQLKVAINIKYFTP